MSAKDNGGPAFPNPALADENYKPQPGDEGMTLRDWFAGQALAGMSHVLNEGDVEWVKQRGAKAAYDMADAMLAARGDA